jgi:hypothetical protein
MPRFRALHSKTAAHARHSSPADPDLAAARRSLRSVAEQYGTLPSSTDDVLLAMALAEQGHRHHVQLLEARRRYVLDQRGQVFGFVAVLAMLVVADLLAGHGAVWPAAGVAAADLAAVARDAGARRYRTCWHQIAVARELDAVSP